MRKPRPKLEYSPRLTSAPHNGPLSDVCVMLVEDEHTLAVVLLDYLEDLGAQIVGPIDTVAEGLSVVANQKFDVAILDVNLGGERTYAIADELRKRAIPFIFLTGYASWAAPDYHDVPVLQKPFDQETLLPTLASLLGRTDLSAR